jgi:Cu/Zn superoxide dismutase
MERKLKFWIMGLLVAGLFVTGCEEEDEPMADAQVKSYTLAALDASGVSGTVTFSKQSESTTMVTIQLSGTQPGNSHPAHIHANNATEGGPIVLDFNPVDGATGKSETIVTKFNDGKPATFEQLISYNGHVNVHKSTTELAVMLAQGNIGSNATGSTPNSGNNGGTNGGY